MLRTLSWARGRGAPGRRRRRQTTHMMRDGVVPYTCNPSYLSAFPTSDSVSSHDPSSGRGPWSVPLGTETAESRVSAFQNPQPGPVKPILPADLPSYRVHVITFHSKGFLDWATKPLVSFGSTDTPIRILRALSLQTGGPIFLPSYSPKGIPSRPDSEPHPDPSPGLVLTHHPVLSASDRQHDKIPRACT